MEKGLLIFPERMMPGYKEEKSIISKQLVQQLVEKKRGVEEKGNVFNQCTMHKRKFTQAIFTNRNKNSFEFVPICLQYDFKWNDKIVL